MERLVVDKLWSLNSRKVKTISLNKAVKMYGKYIIAYVKYYKKLSLSGIKSFIVWLETEI
ncbi:MAG: hypothetical protein WC976_06345 [Caldisericia bacterium]